MTNSFKDEVQYQFKHGGMGMKLILINVTVFLLIGLFRVVAYFSQSEALAAGFEYIFKLQATSSWDLLKEQPWGILTYAFIHYEFLHLLFNMLWLYWFSEIFNVLMGGKKILPLYIAGSLAGFLFFFLSYNYVPVLKPAAEVGTMVGASAGVFAVIFGAIALSPNYEMGLLFFGPVRIKYLGIAALVLDVINMPHGNTGGYFAHIGGALAGYLYIKALQNGFDFSYPFKKVGKLFTRSSAVKMVHRSDENKAKAERPRTDSEQKRIDDILDKISRSGYESLSKEEREFLFQYSNKE